MKLICLTCKVVLARNYITWFNTKREEGLKGCSFVFIANDNLIEGL